MWMSSGGMDGNVDAVKRISSESCDGGDAVASTEYQVSCGNVWPRLLNFYESGRMCKDVWIYGQIKERVVK